MPGPAASRRRCARACWRRAPRWSARSTATARTRRPRSRGFWRRCWTGGTLGLVAGQRVDRKDRRTRRLASRLANGLRGWLLDDHTRDTGCGLKAFPREVFLSLPYFDHQHRFLPALVRREGYEIRLVDVAHRPRTAGRTKYTNFGRAMVGLLDLLGVWWLLRRRKLASVVHEDS